MPKIRVMEPWERAKLLRESHFRPTWQPAPKFVTRTRAATMVRQGTGEWIRGFFCLVPGGRWRLRHSGPFVIRQFEHQ